MTWFINFLWLHLPNHSMAFELALSFGTLTPIEEKSFPINYFPITLVQNCINVLQDTINFIIYQYTLNVKFFNTLL